MVPQPIIYGLPVALLNTGSKNSPAFLPETILLQAYLIAITTGGMKTPFLCWEG